MTIGLKPLPRKEWHGSITADRVQELADSEMFGLDNPGLCLKCGEEAEGCEPDARNYRCDGCGSRQVFGVAEVALMMF
jgi:hypothetical protein